MNCLFIGGTLPDNYIDEIIKNSKNSIQFSSNNFQNNIIDGLKDIVVNLNIISAPFIGSFPYGYKKVYF